MASAASKGILNRGGGKKGGGSWRTGRTGRDSHEGRDDDERMGDLNLKTEDVDDGGSCSYAGTANEYGLKSNRKHRERLYVASQECFQSTSNILLNLRIQRGYTHS